MGLISGKSCYSVEIFSWRCFILNDIAYRKQNAEQALPSSNAFMLPDCLLGALLSQQFINSPEGAVAEDQHNVAAGEGRLEAGDNVGDVIRKR